jgi:hypothetical protein
MQDNRFWLLWYRQRQMPPRHPGLPLSPRRATAAYNSANPVIDQETDSDPQLNVTQPDLYSG